jgi:hypothetical protein
LEPNGAPGTVRYRQQTGIFVVIKRVAFITSIIAGEWSKAIPGINGIMPYFKIDATKFAIELYRPL